MLPTTKLDGPSELGLLIGPVEYCAPSTSRSVVEEQTIPSLSLKAAPDIVQQYLRNATGFTALATAQRHVRNLYETVLNPARYTIEHNPNLNRAQETRTESDAKSMATQVVPLETDEKTSKPGRRSSKAKEQEATQTLAGIHSAGNRSARRARFEIAFVHLLAQFVRCAPSGRSLCLSAHLLLIQRDPAARVRGPCR